MRQHLWRACYELLASQVPSPDWAFMNYGFAPLAPGTLRYLSAQLRKEER